ncbi:putative Ataxin-3 [Paratrimastix pyriformis]|uniref:ubiquitinyl hydrolase 1 n=1 Tax=Paratrimastix pyriformis TaxID=342808 RepID=A0ABQ8UL71_9EUKA|nr:putative Ataxin-3 [Paratrimastix pyriformis]
MTETVPLRMIYFEPQVEALCGLHCLNNLMQYSAFTELDLIQIAQDLDSQEKSIFAEDGLENPAFLQLVAGNSKNYSEGGFFSSQVLTKALEIYGLRLIPALNAEVAESMQTPMNEIGFVCNLDAHWFTLRKFGDYWYELDSLKSQPKHVSDTFLALYLEQIRQSGYQVYVVRGQYPPCRADDAAQEYKIRHTPPVPASLGSPPAQVTPSGGLACPPVFTLSSPPVSTTLQQTMSEEEQLALAIAMSKGQ